MATYVVLTGLDFWHFLNSHHLSRWLTAALVVLLAVGWNWWFRRLDKESKVTTIGLNASKKSNHG
jgi:membrane protein DedA with SNARE-associated domain